jgi:hypothetical protein
MKMPGKILWYGESPLPGTIYKLDMRGFKLLENPDVANINIQLLNPLLSSASIVIFNHSGEVDDSNIHHDTYKQLPLFINHGLLVLILSDRGRWSILKEDLKRLHPNFTWDEEIRFLTDLKGINFDNIVSYQRVQPWKNIKIEKLDLSEELKQDEKLLVCRAFQKAEELHIRELKSGFTPSRVFLAYEKMRVSSIAHWTQPRLVKIGESNNLANEIKAMKEVSPFVPFELRPNLEVYIEGFSKSVYVADFVEKSESMLEAARAGRAEAAISNLFNRTLQLWRDRAWQCTPPSIESLALAAKRLEIIYPDIIENEYLESVLIEDAAIDVNTLWATLVDISFEHRAATIHGDLHGDNIRVRGDDAILIDLGAVKGTDEYGKGAPICFDVAMLEVALVFTCTDDENRKDQFNQPEWENAIRRFYDLNAILNPPKPNPKPKQDDYFWLFGCLRRVRAFGIYEQSDKHEYAIALVIAMWRLCKFPSLSQTDRGRRVIALDIGAKLISQIEAERRKST